MSQKDWQSRPRLVIALLLTPAVAAPKQQQRDTWPDNSGCRANFIFSRTNRWTFAKWATWGLNVVVQVGAPSPRSPTCIRTLLNYVAGKW